jgi:hypothetical protein
MQGSGDKESGMARCEVCGNEYDKTMEITREGETHTFDSFECAIHEMAPTCDHCGCRVIGHGIEAGGSVYCCAHCAQEEGVEGARDRVGT